MKFNKRKMCTLNEAVLRAVNALDIKETVGTVDQSFVDAANEEKARVEKSKEDFKDFNKNAKDFIETNHNRETKVEKDAGLKKLNLSESLFEDVNYGDPMAMGRGACCPTLNNYTKTIEDCLAALDDSRTSNLAAIQLTRYYLTLLDNKNDVENFNAYWTERYPAMIKFIDDQVALIPRDKLRFKDVDESIGNGLINVNLPVTANVPVTANIQANGNKVPFMNGMTTESCEDEDKEPLAESPVAVAEPETKKRARSANEKKYKGDYSSEDLWLAVYDELSADLDNEGSGQQVDKQIKAKRGERYEHVYPVEGSSDLVVYAVSPDEFEFAKKVCDYYEVTYDEPKEDKNKNTNDYYRYSMRIHIPEDELYQWDD